jgi:rubrerythrin
MSNPFNANDIFEIARQIEINGAQFYQDAAARVEKDTHKQFLLDLARMEKDHEQTFARMQAELTGPETAATTFDPEDENALYLKALADTRVFFHKEEPGNSMKKILACAITAEKDSIAFYLGMKELVSKKEGQARINGIIKEEMRHIKLLAGKLLQLNP